jgi:hypothetical protein
MHRESSGEFVRTGRVRLAVAPSAHRSSAGPNSAIVFDDASVPSLKYLYVICTVSQVTLYNS